MSNKTWKSVTPQTILNCFVKASFKDSDNYTPIDKNIVDDKWNFVTDYLNLDDRIFTHYVGINNYAHVWNMDR